MSTRMDQKLYECRMESIKYDSYGVRPSTWTKELGAKYHKKPETVWRDWNRRKNWLALLVRMSGQDQELDTCRAKLMLIEKSAWDLRINADNSNAKSAALKIILDIINRRLELAGFHRQATMNLSQDKPLTIVVKKWELPENAKLTTS